MLLSHIGEYASEYSEYVSLKFAVNSPKNCEYIANIFTSVIPRPLFKNMLQMHCECLPMPYELLTIVANGANGLKNKCCDCLANVMNACECLQMGLQTLQTYL